MIERVGGLDDSRVSDYRHVGDPGWLRARQLFVAEGRLVVRRLLAASSRFRAVSLLVTDAALHALEDALPRDCDVYVCGKEELSAITGYNFHRGCLALGQRGSIPPTDDALAEADLLVGLEGISNPDNVGGIFRSAAAFGAAGVLLDAACGDPLYRKAIRTSMGAVLAVPFARVEEWPAALGAWRARGFRIVALTPSAGAPALEEVTRDLRARGRTILLAGAEGPGLTPEALAQADVRLRIPIAPAVDSLNVAVAVSIALHAFRSL